MYKPVEGQQRDQSWAVRSLASTPKSNTIPSHLSFIFSSKVSRTNSRCESVPFFVCPSSIFALSAEANDKDIYLFVTGNKTEQTRYSPTFVTVAETTEKVPDFYVYFYFRPSDMTRLVQLQPKPFWDGRRSCPCSNPLLFSFFAQFQDICAAVMKVGV